MRNTVADAVAAFDTCDGRCAHSFCSAAAMLAVPLGKGQPSPAALIDLAATLFDQEQISLGRAARIAGLSYSEMIDELGRRNIDIVRYSLDELKRELACVSTIAGR